jgi:deoxyribodipyrimidine photo-lyase
MHVFLFTRNLRLHDHVASRDSVYLPVCVWERAYGPQSEAALYFWRDAVHGLADGLRAAGSRLWFFKGRHVDALDAVRSTCAIDGVHAVLDVTTRLGDVVARWCRKHGVPFYLHDDLDVLPLGEGRKGDGTAYRVFSAYHAAVQRLAVRRPNDGAMRWCTIQKLPKGAHPLPALPDASRSYLGGRPEDATAAIGRLRSLEAYDGTREFPAVDGTSKLSPHLRFGTVSPRQAYWAVRDAFGPSHGLLKELHWRGFFLRVTQDDPRVLRNQPLRRGFDAARWRTGKEADRDLSRWKRGRTGVPLVDAGMRCLLATGWMHNRVRMVTACFLVRTLMIDWRRGQLHFARYLVDGDASSNNNNWQWIAGCGADAMPTFRVFNPFLQSFKYDRDATYIKTWVPELRAVPPRDIHAWRDAHAKYGRYPAPMVEWRTKV